MNPKKHTVMVVVAYLSSASYEMDEVEVVHGAVVAQYTPGHKESESARIYVLVAAWGR